MQWKSTQYLVNYFDFGFVKRGVVGTLFSMLKISQLKGAIIVMSVALFGIFLMVVYIGLYKIPPGDDRRESVDIIKTVVALSPFTAFQFSYDMGRFDLINIILLIVALHLVKLRQLGLTTVISVLALLIHEAFFVYGIPLIVAFALQGRNKNDPNSYSLKLVAYVSSVACVAVLIYLYGSSEKILKSDLGIGGVAWSRAVLQPNFDLSVIEAGLCILILMGLYGWLYHFYKKNNGRIDWIFLATLAPLSLFLLGLDYARWCSLIFCTVLIAVALKVLQSKWIINMDKAGWIILLFMMPVGPVGVTEFFPVLKSVTAGLSGLF